MRWFIITVTVIALQSAAARAQFLGKSVAQWAMELEKGDDAAKRKAAFALGKTGAQGAPAVPYLKNALSSEKNAKVREAAAFALGEIAQRVPEVGKDGDLVRILTTALKDNDPLVKRSALFALGSLASDAASARAAIEQALDDGRPEVRQSAAWALGRMGDASIPSLRKACRDGDNLVLRDAAASLALLDPELVRAAFPELTTLAGHRDVEVRKQALAALVRSVGPEDAKSAAVYGPLQKALGDGDEEVRRNAAFALGNIGGQTAARAVDILLDALRRGDIELKRQSAAALRNIGPHAEKAVKDLLVALKENDVELRGFAALALGGIGRKAGAAVPELVNMVVNTSETKENRAEAASALSSIGDVKAAVEAVPRLLAVVLNPQEDGRVRERTLWALRVHNVDLQDMPAIFPALVRVLKEPPTAANRMVRYDSAYLMGMVYGPKTAPEAFPVLLGYLKDEKIQVFLNKATSVQGAGQETSGGKASSRELGKGDGRTLAVEALTRIGVARVGKEAAIIEQLRRLADNPETLAGLRKDCRTLLQSLGE